MALTSRKQDDGMGKILTTPVRRLTSWLTRSSMLLVLMHRRWLSGKSNTVNPYHCPLEEDTQRQIAKDYLKGVEKDFSTIRFNLINAGLKNQFNKE